MELENSKESIGKLLKSVNLASLLNNNVQKKKLYFNRPAVRKYNLKMVPFTIA